MRPRSPRLAYDVSQCSGCLSCVMNCAQARSGRTGPGFSRIRFDLEPFTGNHVLHHCRQCDEPECMEACDFGALQRDGETCAVAHLDDECTQCGACVEACSFGMITRNEETSEILKCDLCSGSPVCADSCFTGALRYAEEDET